MGHHKIACQQCSEYRRCSLKTRLFINYCGSHSKGMEKRIQDAVAECRSRGGFVFKHRNSPLVDAKLMHAAARVAVSPVT